MTVTAGIITALNDIYNSPKIQAVLIVSGLACVVCSVAFQIFQNCKEKSSDSENTIHNRYIKVEKPSNFIDLDKIIIH
jgi:hypothetical protein